VHRQGDAQLTQRRRWRVLRKLEGEAIDEPLTRIVPQRLGTNPLVRAAWGLLLRIGLSSIADAWASIAHQRR
jgi:hypothetical protein